MIYALLLILQLAPIAERLHLITLHGPGGQVIEVNVAEISSIRAAATSKGANLFHHDTVQCILRMTNGNFNAVVESCAEVDAILANAEGKEQ
jgi:hypothetical protein